MQAVRERQDEVRLEIGRHRIGAAHARRARASRGLSRWRKALGRLVVNFGLAIEGDEPAAEGASLPCS